MKPLRVLLLSLTLLGGAVVITAATPVPSEACAIPGCTGCTGGPGCFAYTLCEGGSCSPTEDDVNCADHTQ